jgi:hypothetical protein
LEITGDDPTKTIVRIDLTAGGRAPRLCADPATLDFGQVGQGTSAEEGDHADSCGVSPLVLTDVALAAGTLRPPSPFPPPPQLPMERWPPASTTSSRSSSPRRSWGRGDRRVSYNSDAGEGFVLLAGEGVKEPTCDIQIAPKAIDFGLVPLTASPTASSSAPTSGRRPAT